MAEKNQSDHKPMVLLFAGPNGSGKTTVKEYFDIVGRYTNADDIVSSTDASNLEAAKRVDKMRYESISRLEDFTFESVFSSQYKIELLQRAKDKGYFIKCIFILTVNPKINISRVHARTAQGGHDVSAEKICSRYYKSLKNIKFLLKLCDILHVYDNSTDKPVRIIRKHKEDISIYPNNIWDEESILKLLE